MVKNMNNLRIKKLMNIILVITIWKVIHFSKDLNTMF